MSGPPSPDSGWSRRRLLAALPLAVPAVARGGGHGLPDWADAEPGSEEEAKRRLREACEAVGGRSAWLSLPPISAGLRHSWSPAARPWRPPVPSGSARLTLHFERDKARVDFADRPQSCWGYDSQESWFSRHGRRVPAESPRAAHFVPALKWFAAMPHKLLDPGARHRIWSPAPHRPRMHVLVRFDTANGRTGDRMVATLRPDDRRIESLVFTARAFGERVVGRAAFEEWARVGSSALPTRVSVSLQAPAPVPSVLSVRLVGWAPADVPPDFFEKPEF